MSTTPGATALVAPPISVVIVDDSPVQRRFLRAAVEAAADLTVVGEARNGLEAVALVARLRPSAVLMDLDLPVLSGLEAIERIMAASPTPIIVCSAFTGGAEGVNALEAIAAGAVDVIDKPAPDESGSLDGYAEALRRRVRVASRVRVITHPRGRLRPTETTGTASRSAAVAVAVAGSATPTASAIVAPRSADRSGRSLSRVVDRDVESSREGVRLLVIGASTGGPQALLTVLSALPADLPQAVLVVQHMAEGFIPGLASWLDALVPLPVGVGQSGRRLQPGTVTVAPSGGNLLVQDDRLRVMCTPPDPGQFHVPGIDATMRSVAEALGPQAVGVLLTGMGRDGAEGMLALRKTGALTVGQDEATSAVYGMPAAAAALDAVVWQLPVEGIAQALLDAVGAS